MPFVRFSRDRRGYEHTYLIHAPSKKGGPTKILYWYRTPAGVKIGRPAFDDAVRRTLEAQYPGVAFDWQKLSDARIPPVDVENWRDKRRAERAAKQARQAAARDDHEEATSVFETAAAFREDATDLGLASESGFEGVTESEPALEVAPDAAQDLRPDTLEDLDDADVDDDAESGEETSAAASPEGAAAAEVPARRRRRRGGRRRRRGSNQPPKPPE